MFGIARVELDRGDMLHNSLQSTCAQSDNLHGGKMETDRSEIGDIFHSTRLWTMRKCYIQQISTRRLENGQSFQRRKSRAVLIQWCIFLCPDSSLASTLHF